MADPAVQIVGLKEAIKVTKNLADEALRRSMYYGYTAIQTNIVEAFSNVETPNRAHVSNLRNRLTPFSLVKVQKRERTRELENDLSDGNFTSRLDKRSKGWDIGVSVVTTSGKLESQPSLTKSVSSGVSTIAAFSASVAEKGVDGQTQAKLRSAAKTTMEEIADRFFVESKRIWEKK